MRIVNIFNPYDLITELVAIRDKGSYIFRGQPNSKFVLQPSAFRDNEIKRFTDTYAISSCNEWTNSESVKNIIRKWFLDETFIYDVRIKRLIKLNLYFMHYNYYLAKYIEKNIEKIDQATIELFRERDHSFWSTEKTFIWMLEQDISLSIGIISREGKVLKESYISEESSGYDEYLPQHYGIPTVALDWSYNPFIAVFFAIQEISSRSSHFSIYAYKEINNDKRNPIEVKQARQNSNNLRLKRQEGIFTRFRYACLNYLNTGNWPCIESYNAVSLSNFELIRFDVPSSHADHLEHLLEEKGITKEFLMPV